jgi:translocator protein
MPPALQQLYFAYIYVDYSFAFSDVRLNNFNKFVNKIRIHLFEITMWIKLLISVAIPLITGAVASWATIPEIAGWYAGLNKPSFNPPNYLFGPVWTTLYILMGIALFLVWKSDTAIAVKKTAITLFAVQLTLNFFWSIIFFYAHQPGWALVEIVAMWLSILLTIIAFSKISTAAAWLLVPYICWVSFAMVLNAAIWKLN